MTDLKEFTPYVAWYAAAVSTVVFGWDIAKWLRSRPRFRVTAQAPVCYSDGAILATKALPNGGTSQELAEYCCVEIVNIGGQPSTLIAIEATHRAKPRSDRILLSSTAFEVCSGKQLPAKLEPGELWSARIDMRNLTAIRERGKPVVAVRTTHRTTRIVAHVEIQQAGARR